MQLVFDMTHHYELVEDSRIPTAEGALYQAMDLDLQRHVAVKQVHMIGDTPRELEENHAIALREVRAMVRVGDKHLRTPRILNTWFEGSRSELFIVMEWIRGKTLDKVAKYCSRRQFLYWMADLCDTLQEMAQLKVYHKDIKPANLMIVDNRELYLIDFGISFSLPNPVEGSSHYKAPEMEPDGLTKKRDKVDMFSVGVLLYEHFTGVLPKRGEHYSTNFICRRKWSSFLRPSKLVPDLPQALDEIIVTCMKRDPRERYATMAQLRDALKEVARNYGK